MGNLNFRKIILVVIVMMLLGAAIIAGILSGFATSYYSKKFQTGYWEQWPVALNPIIFFVGATVVSSFSYSVALSPGLAIFWWIRRVWRDVFSLFFMLVTVTGISLSFTFVYFVTFTRFT